MPALALADALAAAGNEVEPVLVGAARGVEAALLPSRPYRFHLLPVEPIYRRAWWRNLRWPLILARVLRQGAKVLTAEQPAVAVGTGGYAAGPILLQALRRGVPLALQEQNVVPGLTTRWLARHARHIYLGFPEGKRHLRLGAATEVFEFGNPITPPPSPLPERGAARARLGIAAESRVVFVMGGSQGARSVNRAVAAILDAGLWRDVTLLWSTGAALFDQYRHYHRPPLRQLRGFWDPIAEAYAAADVVVSRAGAMTTAELCAWGLPAVLVPLPGAPGDHQSRNAEALARAGAAMHVPEASLGEGSLGEEVRRLLDDPSRLAAMGRKALARGHPKAAEDTARQILALVS
jgi:UDP-N-acetylglucosamine--N-acetylmuramyl-(pentapeptide) pyrophosphoryl-undecaprenol N-acetylglucosamine transferase